MSPRLRRDRAGAAAPRPGAVPRCQRVTAGKRGSAARRRPGDTPPALAANGPPRRGGLRAAAEAGPGAPRAGRGRGEPRSAGRASGAPRVGRQRWARTEGRGSERGGAGQGRGDWGARAGEGELFSAVGEALRQARAAAACGPERLAARRGWGGPGACPGCASQPVRSSRLLSYGANPPKLGAQIP